MASTPGSSSGLLTLRHRPTPLFNHRNRKLICNPTSVECLSSLPLATVLRKHRKGQRLEQLSGASSEGRSQEHIEDSKFVPLNADDPVYGPPALLLLGFKNSEMPKIQHFLEELDGGFLKIIQCSEDMLSLSIWDAMHVQQSNLETVKVAKSLPRMCIMSGLTGEEMLMFIDAFPEIGLEPAVFAALVPNSANKLLEEVVEEIMGDHEMMSSRQPS